MSEEKWRCITHFSPVAGFWEQPAPLGALCPSKVSTGEYPSPVLLRLWLPTLSLIRVASVESWKTSPARPLE
jgi:hypothetical protein